MLHIEIDSRSAVPAYRQLMDQVKYYVASGAVRGGDRLPSIRELSRYLGVNPTTVVKAYTELEHEGAIERRHGKGVFVRDGVESLSRKELAAALHEAARRLAVEALQMGAPRELVLRVVREELTAVAKGKKPGKKPRK